MTTYTFTPINPGASATYVSAINNAGQVTGFDISLVGYYVFGFVYNNGTYTAINPPPISSFNVLVMPNAINDIGEITGSASSDYIS
jgi:hypothetical protein